MSRLRKFFQEENWLDAGSARVDDVGPGNKWNETLALSDILVQEALVSDSSRIACYSNPHCEAADRFRLLRMRLHELRNRRPLKKLLITSPLPGDGKSTIALNLASAMSDKGKRAVLLLEADLHHPSLTRALALSQWPGLVQCLETGSDPLMAVRYLQPLKWYLLPAGEPSVNSTELLQSDMLVKVLDQLSRYFDWIFIDSPPVVPLSDVASLSKHTDASLLVLRASHTSKEVADEAIKRLGNQHLVGVILNGTERAKVGYSHYGYCGDKQQTKTNHS